MASKDPSNLGKFFADIVCSPHNQNVMIRFVALAGYGKSWAALRLAYNISKYIALHKGKTANDYFNFEKDLAVISLEEVQRVMEEAEKYHVLLLDDVTAKAMNARNFQQKSSKDLNSIIQTWRPNHNALITTQQAGFLVDKVWRSLFNYEIEICESHHDQGYVIAKVFRLSFQHNKNEVYREYITCGRFRYKRHLISAPPKEWRQAYEDERAKQLKKIKEKEEQADDILDKKQVKEKKSDVRMKLCTPFIFEAIEENPYSTQDEIIKRIKDKHFIEIPKKELTDFYKLYNLNDIINSKKSP